MQWMQNAKHVCTVWSCGTVIYGRRTLNRARIWPRRF